MKSRTSAAEPKLPWAVIGVGVAGRARAKAIEGDPRARLASTWRGRFASEFSAPHAESFESAVQSASAVAICSPTAEHPSQVRAALDAGRHVVVEFPLAPDAATAEALFAHARAKGLVLHEEHIELLDAACSTLVAHVRDLTVRSVAVSFERPGPDDEGPAGLALGNVARLHRVVAVGGPVASVDEVKAEPGRLTAKLTLRSGAWVEATFQQAPYLTRRTALTLDTLVGRWEQRDDQLFKDGAPVTLVGLGALFVRDQRAATARILDHAAPYVSERRVLHVMDVVDRLSHLEPGPIALRPAAQRSDAGAAG